MFTISSMSGYTYIVIFLILILLNIGDCENAKETYKKSIVHAPIIELPEGKLKGKIISSSTGKRVFAYLGIPYAKAPIGELRFKYPQAPEPWTGIWDATRERDRCPQLSYPERNYEGTEDCLFLNIYTSHLPINNSVEGTVIWDVIVLIHGGGFTFGSGDADMYGPDHLLDRDIVLVTFNYRLGALGFLSTGDEFAPGNYGLKDQVDVLRWVRRNIDRFSGNPNSVTVLGAHAGGASAHYHMLSPLSSGLLHGAISQSGTALAPWAHMSVQEAHHRALKLGQLVGCSKELLEDSQGLIKCLRKKQPEDLVKQAIHVVLDKLTKFHMCAFGGSTNIKVEFHLSPGVLQLLQHNRITSIDYLLLKEWATDLSFPFVPVVEPIIPGQKSFIHDHPEKLIAQLKGRHSVAPWIIGVTSHEGLPQALQMMVFPKMMDNLNSDPEKYIPLYLGMTFESENNARNIGRQVWNYYLQNETLDFSTLLKLAALTSDYNYFHGVSKSVTLHTDATDAAPVFVYHFSYNRRQSLITLGVPQGDDTQYLFPDTIAGEKLKLEDDALEMVDRLVTLVTNFARNGDPTPEEILLLNNVVWPTAESKNFEFIDIGKDIKIEKEGFYLERMVFWEKIEKQMRKEDIAMKDEL